MSHSKGVRILCCISNTNKHCCITCFSKHTLFLANVHPFTEQFKVTFSVWLSVKTQESLSGLFDIGEFYEKLCGHLVFIVIRQFLTTILDSLLLDVS